MAQLIVQNGKLKGTKIPIPAREVSVGRDENSYIRLTSSEVSRQHCILKATPEGVLVRDAGSQNGIIINDARIKGETELRPGDVLRIGPICFAVEVPPVVLPPTPLDNEIADWLAESDTSTAVPSSADTTVMESYQPDAPPEDVPATSSSSTAETKPKTVAEEADAIIRRHFKLKSQQDR